MQQYKSSRLLFSSLLFSSLLLAAAASACGEVQTNGTTDAASAVDATAGLIDAASGPADASAVDATAGQPDAVVAAVDAMVAPAVDAAVAPDAAAILADGMACAASTADPQGGCPTTHACLGSKCMELCDLDLNTMTPNQMDCPNYTGPGESTCLLSVISGDQVVAAACLITCENTSGVGSPCSNCDGTCPNTFSCLQSTFSPDGLKVCQ